jgi:G patch domain-containing protein 1
LQAIFSDDSDDDMDEPLSNKQVDPVKTSEGANMALNRLVAEDFLESLGKELGLEVPAEKPAVPQNVLFRSEILPTADGSVSRNEKTTACREIKENEIPFDKVKADNANGDGFEKLDSKYEKQEHRAEKDRSHSSHRQVWNGSSESDTEIARHRSRKRRSHHKIRSATPDSDSSGERRRSKKRKSHSRHRTVRSRTPDADSSSDSQKNKRKRQEKRSHRTCTPDIDSSDEYKDKYASSSRKSSDKDRSRKRSRHRRHRSRDPA